MKIVFMGTPAFAARSLQKLIDEGYEIPLVVTQPDRKGNRNKMILSEVRKLAIDHGIETAQPTRIRKDPELIERIREIAPDMIVVAAFGQILPKSVLDIPRLGCINVHGSLLPKLRGASPMQAAVLQGLDETGITIMRMAEGLDTGDMLRARSTPIGEMETAGELTVRLAQLGAQLLSETLPDYLDGKITPVPQDPEKASYQPMLKKAMGEIDLNTLTWTGVTALESSTVTVKGTEYVTPKWSKIATADYLYYRTPTGATVRCYYCGGKWITENNKTPGKIPAGTAFWYYARTAGAKVEW